VDHIVRRTAASALVLAFAMVTFATPAAADTAAPAARSSISALSPASMQMLRSATPAPRMQEGSAPSPGGFFKSRRGAVALSLIAAGIGFTIWSAVDSREPVKSPIR
jgi:hypothetical protein